VKALGVDALRQVVGTVLDKPEQLNALAKMDELQREAPDLAGRRMRYPGSASRARRPSTGSVPARSLAAADRMRLARAEGRASAHRFQRRQPDGLSPLLQHMTIG